MKTYMANLLRISYILYDICFHSLLRVFMFGVFGFKQFSIVELLSHLSHFDEIQVYENPLKDLLWYIYKITQVRKLSAAASWGPLDTISDSTTGGDLKDLLTN